MQSQPFGNQQSVRQEELNQGVTQHMVVGGAHIRQPVQCMMMNQGLCFLWVSLFSCVALQGTSWSWGSMCKPVCLHMHPSKTFRNFSSKPTFVFVRLDVCVCARVYSCMCIRVFACVCWCMCARMLVHLWVRASDTHTHPDIQRHTRTLNLVCSANHLRIPYISSGIGVPMGDMSGSTGAVSGAGPSGQCQQRPPSAAEQANMVSKCARFFKTLIHLSQQPDRSKGQQTAVRVTELVKVIACLMFSVIPSVEGKYLWVNYDMSNTMKPTS